MKKILPHGLESYLVVITLPGRCGSSNSTRSSDINTVFFAKNVPCNLQTRSSIQEISEDSTRVPLFRVVLDRQPQRARERQKAACVKLFVTYIMCQKWSSLSSDHPPHTAPQLDRQPQHQRFHQVTIRN